MATAYGARATAMEVTYGVDLRGRTAVVTGANSGIGLETARVLALRGASVVMACRDEQAGGDAREALLADAEGRIDPARLQVQRLDLGHLQSVRQFAERYVRDRRRLHLLINNAGLMLGRRQETRDGLEAHFGVNHLGHFYLTYQLLGTLEASAPARVITVASDAMRASTLTPALEDLNWSARRYRWLRAYADSKLMNLMFTRELDRRLGGSGVVAHCVHPGVVATRLARERTLGMVLVGALALPFMRSPAQGAATTLFAATHPSCHEPGGLYLASCRPQPCPPLAEDVGACQALWEKSAQTIGALGQPITPPLSARGAQPVAN